MLSALKKTRPNRKIFYDGRNRSGKICPNHKSKDKRVLVALSGGVDSSVAAFLLKKEGYEVIGVYIRGYNIDGCAEDDVLIARRIAGKLEIPFYVWDMEDEYKRSVVDYMISAYKSGITPNPDVMCNKEIKFGLFYKKARKLGADYIATGHYALKDNKKNILRVAKDKEKDQTYFLWTLNNEFIKNSLFPLGGLLKSEVRQIAARAGLPNAERKDSQGVCFLGKLKMSDFLSQYIKENPGPIVNPEGQILGAHRGLSFYTLGQRHLGIKGMGGGEALYVASKNKDNNSLIIAPKNHPLLFTKNVSLFDINLTSSITQGSEVYVRVRYRQPFLKANLFIYPVRNSTDVFPLEKDLFLKGAVNQLKRLPSKISDGVGNKKGKLIFVEPAPFVAPGQSAVFYSPQGEMLGGGIIV